MRIVIAGGTGTVGRHIVQAAQRRGHDAVVLARSTGADLTTGAGVDAALDGADAAVDVTSVATMSESNAVRFFETTAKTLASVARRTGLGHLLILSIVGIDRAPYGYYAGKLAQERVVARAETPWSIVRATQFHEFAGQIARQARFAGVQLAPRARVQPIAAAVLAEHLIDVLEGGPAGRAQDVAGPREEQLSALIREQVRHDGHRGGVIPVSMPGAQLRAMRKGAVLPGPDALRVGPTFAEWLSSSPVQG
ncbi:SDR family oxidoreductase [uncultured Microbacterium sp.]|uniref:SDR family oxidoreductase n=1 Tax=uncultured Microbacterium sp. TaxID=191216 RepID=UPI0025D7DF6C|nr:NAD(P)H-binding protein [uncultured Microbacterium sp.]